MSKQIYFTGKLSFGGLGSLIRRLQEIYTNLAKLDFSTEERAENAEVEYNFEQDRLAISEPEYIKRSIEETAQFRGETLDRLEDFAKLYKECKRMGFIED